MLDDICAVDLKQKTMRLDHGTAHPDYVAVSEIFQKQKADIAKRGFDLILSFYLGQPIAGSSARAAPSAPVPAPVAPVPAPAPDIDLGVWLL